MKKLYILLAALAVAFSANAVKFFADLGGWQEFALTDGSYTLQVGNGASVYFTFTNDGSSNAWSRAWRPSNNSDQNVSEPGTYQALRSGSNGCFYINQPGTYILTPNASNYSFTVAYEDIVPEDNFSYKLHGSFTGSNWGGAEFEKQDDGTWVATQEVTVNGAAFGIQKNNNGVQVNWLWGPSGTSIDGDAEIQLGVEGVTPGANISIAPGEYEFTLNPDDLKLVVKKAGEITTTFTYALHGSFKGTWASVDFAKNAAGVLEAKVEVTAEGAQFGVKEMDAGEQVEWLWAAEHTTIEGDTEITLVAQSNVGTGQNMSIKPGSYTFTFNPDNFTLVVKKDGDVVVTAQRFFLVGGFNGWNAGDEEYEFTEADGTYTLYVASLQGEFKICGEDWNEPNYGANTTPEMGQTTTLSLDGGNLNFADEVKQLTITFTWTPGAGEIEAKFTSAVDGIASIEAEAAEAVYYNLQGIRVAEPQSGIYVKVQAGKATKVAF